MNRRDIGILLIIVAVSVLFTRMLDIVRPLGEDIMFSPTAINILDDHQSPERRPDNFNLTVVVFADYSCSACRKAHTALHAAADQDGKVRIIYKDWPILGERSVRAAKVALASDLQGLYPSVHDELMTRRWDDSVLRSAVELSSGNWQRLQDDLLRHSSTLEHHLAVNQRQAGALGLRGTPAYLIGPLLVRGALSEREFRRAFAQARAKKGG